MNQSVLQLEKNGKPVRLDFGNEEAKTYKDGKITSLEYTLEVKSKTAEIGHFLLGSMRVERDFQYAGWHLKNFSERFLQKELVSLIENIKRLPNEKRKIHLKLLRASGIDELSERLQPKITFNKAKNLIGVEQPTFDGKNHLWVEISSRDDVKL